MLQFSRSIHGLYKGMRIDVQCQVATIIFATNAQNISLVPLVRHWF